MQKRILIIDDDEDSLHLLNLALKRDGYIVFTSNSCGNINDIKAVSPDLVVLDININTSGENGDVMCRKLKENIRTQHLPVLLFSGALDLKERFLRCGADGYLEKPFELNELRFKVKAQLAG